MVWFIHTWCWIIHQLCSNLISDGIPNPRLHEKPDHSIELNSPSAIKVLLTLVIYVTPETNFQQEISSYQHNREQRDLPVIWKRARLHGECCSDINEIWTVTIASVLLKWFLCTLKRVGFLSIPPRYSCITFSK